MGLMKKLTSALVASSLVLSLVGSAFAAYTPAAGEEAGTRMQKLGIITGRDGNDLALNSEITRAELVTVIVRAFGKEDDAKLLKGSTIFPDIQNHWASGNIAMAVALVEKAGSDPIGMPDGTFAPDAKLTPAQAVAFLMKFMGAKADATKAWPANYLDVAVEKGLITTEDKALIAPMLNENATRGLVFYMFDRAFAEYDLGAGKTFYTKYVDQVAPEVTLDAVAETTMDSKVTISGTVKGHTELYVGTEAVTASADGSFSADVDLAEVGEYDILVTAKDLAGNVTEKTVTVARVAGDAVAISAPATLEVVAGKTADVAAAVVDANNVAIADIDVEGTSDVGTFENGVFTAGETAGTGTLTLTYGDLTKEVAVTVKAGELAKLTLDPATVDMSAGTFQKFAVKGADEFGNEVAAPANVTFTSSKGFMGNDGTFAATTDVAGTVTITAKAGDVTGTATANVFGVPAKIVVAAPAAMVANGVQETELVATVQDANGTVVKNYTGTLNFVNNNSGIVSLSGTSAKAEAGTAKVTLTAGTTVGNAVISISGTGLAGTTAIATVGAQVATSVTVTTDPATVAADNASQVTATAVMMDQTGNPMKTAPSGVWTVDFASSDTSVVGPATVSSSFGLTGGKYQATGTFTAKNNLGTANITATVKKDGTASATVTANAVSVSTALVGVPYKLAIDSISDAKATGTTTEKTQNVVVRVLDVNGNQVTGISSAAITNLTLAKNSTASAVIATPSSWTGGKAIFTVTDAKAETVTYTATASWSGNTLAKAEA
ncbi:MAG TPA: hypothetical protein VD973_21805, partial [Symbiobacteriaceae bacterium]|nr:hypothetical protein [Symbiobacteriaceae bacterium]